MLATNPCRIRTKIWRQLYLPVRLYCKGPDGDKGPPKHEAEDLSSEISNDKGSKDMSSTSTTDKKADAKKALFDLILSTVKTPKMPTQPSVSLSRPKSQLKDVSENKPSADSSSSDSGSSSSSSDSEDDEQSFLEDVPVSEEARSAVKVVAESYGGAVKETEQELLKSFKSHSRITSKSSAQNLDSLFTDITVDRQENELSRQKQNYQHTYNRTERHDSPEDAMDRRRMWQGSQDTERHDSPEDGMDRRRRWQGSQDAQLRTYDWMREDSQGDLNHRRLRQQDSDGRKRNIQFQQALNVFEGEPLNIFPEEAVFSSTKPISILPTWDAAARREIEQAKTVYPRNAFEEKIKWIKEGKLWSFPIDNEFGLEKERRIGFHEHVFLEKYLSGWCPKKGPLRHFMELVITGLSKNPYITVERKKAHIEWYKNYFAEKDEILRSVGVFGDQPSKST